VQLVACSATASYRLREELCRLFEIAHEADLSIISPADARSARKRSSGERGLGGVGVPSAIIHWWASCDEQVEKAPAVATVLSQLGPRVALLFLDDDAPLRATVAELQREGVNAQMLHEAMGFGASGGEASAGVVDGSSYLALQASLKHAHRVVDGHGAEGLAPGTPVEAVEAAEAGAKEGRVGAGEDNLLLVSTYSSSRGLDLPHVDCVLLYDLPASADQYLHLAGRCGRQGLAGSVVSLLMPEQQSGLGVLTRQLGISIKQNAELAVAIDEARRERTAANGRPS